MGRTNDCTSTKRSEGTPRALLLNFSYPSKVPNGTKQANAAKFFIQTTAAANLNYVCFTPMRERGILLLSYNTNPKLLVILYRNLANLYGKISDYDNEAYYRGKIIELAGFKVDYTNDDDENDNSIL